MFVERDGQVNGLGSMSQPGRASGWCSVAVAGVGAALAGEVCSHWSPGSGRSSH